MEIVCGEILEGTISGITGFGAFIDLPGEKTGLVHISEVSTEFVKDIREHLSVGQKVKVKVMRLADNGHVALSIRRALAPAPDAKRPFRSGGAPKARSGPKTFEEMMSTFKQSSEEKFAALKNKTKDNRRGASRKKGG